MKQKFLNIIAFVALAFGLQSSGDAAIIVTFVQTSLPTSQNVGIDVYATSNVGAGEQVAAYGFTVNLNGAVIGSTTVTYAGQNNSTTSWSGLENGTGFGNLPSTGLTFRGGGFPNEPTGLDPGQPYSVLIGSTVGTAVVPNVPTRIGQISFLAGSTSYTPSVSFIATGLSGRIPAVTGTGFLGVGFTQIQANPLFSGTITAVPEPSSIALVALCAGGIGLGAVRARRNRKS